MVFVLSQKDTSRMLSELTPGHTQLSRLYGNGLRLAVFGRTERFIQPIPQVTVYQKVHAQKVDQVGKRPTKLRLQLEKLNQQHCDQCCPNLNPNGIRRHPHETFYPQILLQHLEEAFNLPAVFVNGGDRGRCPTHLIGEKFQSVSVCSFDRHDSEKSRIALSRGFRRKLHDLVRDDFSAWADRPLLNDLVTHLLLQTSDEADALLLESTKPFEIHIASIERQYRPRLVGPLPGDGQFGIVPRCDDHRRWQIARMIEREMQLHRSFLFGVFGPRKQLRTQGHVRRIDTQQFLLNPQFVFRADFRLAARIHRIKHLLKQLPWPVRVRIRQCGFRRCFNSKLLQSSSATAQTTTDLSQRLSIAELTKQHRHKLVPTAETTSMPLGSRLFNELFKLRSRKKLEQLIHDAAKSLHGTDLSCWIAVLLTLCFSIQKVSPFSGPSSHASRA